MLSDAVWRDPHVTSLRRWRSQTSLQPCWLSLGRLTPVAPVNFRSTCRRRYRRPHGGVTGVLEVGRLGWRRARCGWPWTEGRSAGTDWNTMMNWYTQITANEKSLTSRVCTPIVHAKHWFREICWRTIDQTGLQRKRSPGSNHCGMLCPLRTTVCCTWTYATGSYLRVKRSHLSHIPVYVRKHVLLIIAPRDLAEAFSWI